MTHELLLVVLIATLLALYARTFVLQAYRIPTPSMEPGLLVGDDILVNKFMFGPAPGASPLGLSRWLLPIRPVMRGDLVLFRSRARGGEELLKRCVAVAGDVVELRDKELLLNGELLDESRYKQHIDPHVYPSSEFLDPDLRFRDNWGPVEVANGELLCLGDHRDISLDSRAFGSVSVAEVRSRATLVYWSSEPASDPAPFSGSRLARMRHHAGELMQRVRVERIFRFLR